MHGIAEAAAAGLALTRSQSRSTQPSARRIRVAGKRTVLAAASEASAAYRGGPNNHNRVDRRQRAGRLTGFPTICWGLPKPVPRDRLAIGDEI